MNTVRTMMINGRNGLGLAPEMSRWIDRALDVPAGMQGEIQEQDDNAVITVDVPGVKPEQITITAEDRVLHVRAERDGRSAIARQYTIGPKYDLGQVQAHLALGVLTLTLPKAAEAKPRQIAVTVA